MTLKILSNLDGFDTVEVEGVELQIAHCPATRPTLANLLSIFLRSYKYDYLVWNFDAVPVLFFGLFKLLFPFHRCRLIALDLLLPVPASRPARLAARMKSLLLRQYHLFLVYVRNTEGYRRHFRLCPEQFRYVPFKINSYEKILRTECSDKGYLFCGGLSRRDFSALFQAVSGLDCKVLVLTAPNPVLAQHGSFLDDSEVPANVAVIRTDGSAGPFIEAMAAAHCVVLPIKSGISMQAGIAVYIVAMALRKCVVISAGPGVDDVLTDEQAIIVPPGDVTALRQAIERVLTDKEWRERYAERGYRYAMTLQGDQRLRQSIVEELVRDFHRLR